MNAVFRRFLGKGGGVFWLGGAAASFLLGQLALGVGLLSVGVVVFGLMALSNRSSANVPIEDLDNATRVRIRPLVVLQRDITRLIESHPENPVVAAMQMDMQAEVEAIVQRSIGILQARNRLIRLGGGQSRAQTELALLTSRAEAAADTESQQSLEAAIAARRQEVANFRELASERMRLEASLEAAESALAELKSRISVAVGKGGTHIAQEEFEPFSELTRRLKTLSGTMEDSMEELNMKGISVGDS
jgi:hypothetical protein